MIIGVDIGGTKTLVAELSASASCQHATKFPTPETPETALAQIIETITNLPNWQAADAISLGAPGVIDSKDQRFTVGGNLKWRDINLARIIESELSKPCFIENDANLAGLFEARSHNLTTGTVLYLTVSTGIGSGIIVNGHLAPGLTKSEAGQMLVKQGEDYEIWEKFASGKALYELYDKRAEDITDSSVWYRVSDALIPGLLPLLAIVQPDNVIIGGSIGSYFERFSQHLIEQLEEVNQSLLVKIPQFIGANHAEKAVLFGCYEYAQDRLSK